MHIVLPIESQSREFKSKIWLASALSTAGHRVTVGQNNIIWENMHSLDPDVYFALSAFPRDKRVKRLKSMQQDGVGIVVLDTEGGAFQDDTDFFIKRASPEVLKYVDLYLAWGLRSAEIIKEIIQENKLSTKVITTGNPRFDLLQSSMDILHKESSEKIKNDYGRFILINTNFAVNAKCRYNTKNCGFTEKIQEKFPKQTYILTSLISLIYKLVNSDIQKNIIIRPHPNESMTIYNNLLEPYDSVYVKKQGEVRAWLSAADATIHNSCTTGLESVLMRTPTISYMSSELDYHFSNEVSLNANSPSEVINILQESPDVGASQELEKVERYIKNIDTKAAIEITSAISNEFHENSGEFLYGSKTIPQAIGERVYMLCPKFYRKLRTSEATPDRWDHTSYKFSIVSDEKTYDLVAKFSNILQEDVVCHSSYNTDNLYDIELLSRQDNKALS